MSSKQPVMSHDPLADLQDEAPGEVVQVPEGASAAAKADEQQAPAVDGPLVLESSLTIADVGDYQASLMAYLEIGDKVVIDGSGVDTVDGAGLQLLTAFVKEAIEKHNGVSWSGASDSLLRSARQFGVHAALQLEQQDEAA